MKMRPPPGPLEYSRRAWLRLALAVSFIFLYMPILTLIAFSFNDSRRNIVWRGFTLKYYEKAWANDSLIEAFANSLTIAFISTAASIVLGAMTAVLLWRFRFPGRALYERAIELPIVIPEICMGVAMLVFFRASAGPADCRGRLTWGRLPSRTYHSVFLCRRHCAGAARQLQPRIGGGRPRPRRRRMADLPRCLIPHMRPGLVAGGAAGVYPFAGRLCDNILHFRAGHRHLSD